MCPGGKKPRPTVRPRAKETWFFSGLCHLLTDLAQVKVIISSSRMRDLNLVSISCKIFCSRIHSPICWSVKQIKTPVCMEFYLGTKREVVNCKNKRKLYILGRVVGILSARYMLYVYVYVYVLGCTG